MTRFGAARAEGSAQDRVGRPFFAQSWRTFADHVVADLSWQTFFECGNLGHAGLPCGPHTIEQGPPQIEKPKRRAFVFCGLMGYPSDAAAPGVLRKVTYCGRRIGLESRWGGIVHDNLW